MELLFAKLLDTVVFVSVAAMVALAIGNIGHHFFGMTRFDICHDALMLAGLVASFLAIDFVAGRRKHK